MAAGGQASKGASIFRPLVPRKRMEFYERLMAFTEPHPPRKWGVSEGTAPSPNAEKTALPSVENASSDYLEDFLRHEET